MRSNKKNPMILGGLALAASGLLCSSALAADVTVNCTGIAATDTAAIAVALSDADAGGSVRIDSSAAICEINLALNLSLPNQRIYGPGIINQSVAGQAAFRLFEGASGTTFENLDIRSINITIQNWGLGGFLQQPDNVTVRNCRITGLRAVQQFSHNIGTPSDVNRATGAMGAISNNWNVSNNEIDCIGAGPALFLCGNNNVVEDNVITARNLNPALPATMTLGILLQNNTLALAAPLTSLPGAAENIVRHNVVNYATGAATTARGIGTYGYFGPAPAAPNAFGFGNLVEKNCVSVDAQAGFLGIAIQVQHMDDSIYQKNNLTLPLNTPDVSNRGINTIDTRNSIYLDNDTAGGGDAAIAAFTSSHTSEGNLFRGNNFSDSSADIIQPQFVGYDDGRVAGNPNAYVGNKWCRGVIAVTGLSTAVGALNQDGHFCSHPAPELPQAHDCTEGNGFAGTTSLLLGDVIDPIQATRGLDPLAAEFTGAEVEDISVILSTRPMGREIGRRTR